MFIHFYLFGSISHILIFGLIKYLLNSFKEQDLEILLTLMHNIGGSLWKDSPELLKEIISECELRKNNTEAEAWVSGEDKTKHLRKIKFLQEELEDIKNNKIKQSKLLNSLEMYLNWMKKNEMLKSELSHEPLEVDWKLLSSDDLP